VTAEYGKYIATICTMCHGSDLTGAPLPDGSGDFAPSITSQAGPGRWSETQFITTLRSGTTPEGQKLDNELMPWQALGKMTNDELRAIYLFLNSLPPS
jgi:cytochrome c553